MKNRVKKFKSGDKARVISLEKLESTCTSEYHSYFTMPDDMNIVEEMMIKCGKVITIKSIHNDSHGGHYSIEELNWDWSDSLLEPVISIRDIYD